MHTAVIFANGEMPTPDLIKPLIGQDDLLIAADGGLRHAITLGLRPDHLMGDLDSVTEGEMNNVTSSATVVTQFSTEKDQTDLELCLDFALSAGVERCLLVGAMGGRADHALANAFLLFTEKYTGMNLTLIDGITTIGRADPRVLISGSVGDTVSLLPWGASAEGVSTNGLRFPLRNEVLIQGSPRGMSNVMLTSRVTVSVENGKVLYIHIMNGDNSDEN